MLTIWKVTVTHKILIDLPFSYRYKQINNLYKTTFVFLMFFFPDV